MSSRDRRFESGFLQRRVSQAITYRVWATQLGIKLDKVEIGIDGDIDLRGFFGVDDGIRAGFNAVRVNVSLIGPEDPTRYQELASAVSPKTSLRGDAVSAPG